MAMIEATIRLPRPHPEQRRFIKSKAKRKHVRAGRRGGKTTGVAMLAVRAIARGRRILEAAPTHEQTAAFWETCKSYLADVIAKGLIRKNETNRTLRGENGGIIKTKTAWNADTLRGDHADLLILDEFSYMDEDAWTKVGAPMLLDNDGDAVFIYTPARKNHAYRLHQKALADQSGRSAVFSFSSHDNPHLSKDALEEITQDMTEADYRQEILAEFLDDGGLVFRNVRECAIAETYSKANGGAYHIGVDWGRTNDATVITVYDARTRSAVHIDRMTGIEYELQKERLRLKWEAFKRPPIIAEENAMGRPIIESLQREGIRVEPFMTTNATKKELIDKLVLAFERKDILIPNDPVLIGELESYEAKSLPSGMVRYTSPDGLHDDMVISLALAHWAGTQPKGVGVY